MNEKEVAEIRRGFRPEKSNITHVRVCYVNENRRSFPNSINPWR